MTSLVLPDYRLREMEDMQAILMLAHTNFDWVKCLAEKLAKSFEVYIHFDKRYHLKQGQYEELNKQCIHCFQKEKVMWGGYSITAATIYLMKEILKDPRISYVHIISGQDWPAIPVKEIFDFYENEDRIFMLSSRAEGCIKSGQNILNWQCFYYNFDVIPRRNVFGRIYHRVIYKIQQILGVDKLKKYVPGLEIYQGPNWMDLPRYALEYLLEYWDRNEGLRMVFKTGFCPDEFWVQTILENSPYKEKIERNYHRYILWEQKNGSYPAVLDRTDLERVKQGDYHFIRKVIPVYSQELINGLDSSDTCSKI